MRYVLIDLMEYEDGAFCLDGSFREDASDEEDPGGGHLPETFEVRIAGKRLTPERKAAVSAVADNERHLASFSVRAGLPLLQALLGGGRTEEDAKGTVLLRFFDGSETPLAVRAREYQARLTDTLRASFWSFGPFTVSWHFGAPKERDADALALRQTGRRERMRREAALLKEMLVSPRGSRKMFALRCIYWLAYPFWSRKTIWITFDKLYKGGDCGEYFYKYMEGRRRADKRAGIAPVYVLQRDAADYQRLREEGYSPAPYRSVRQRLSYLYASMVFGTHSGVPSFCGLNKWEIQFFQDRLKADNACIQHGLSVQDLTGDSNRLVNNNRRYYCASQKEIDNLSAPQYGYGPGVLRLTGIPRYDGLLNRSDWKADGAGHPARQILVAMTWRADVASPSAMGRQRAYNPEFVRSDYFRIYQELMTDEKLLFAAGEKNCVLLFLIHPVLAAQKGDFHPGKGARIAVPTEVSYEQALTESALMVTDYSGVQFDFAYMRKPVVYFHPPKLPPQYRDGCFSYEKDGFGEICTDVGGLTDILCGYLAAGCEPKEKYKKRADRFFAFDDHENCRRIYEDAREFQEGRKRQARRQRRAKKCSE